MSNRRNTLILPLVFIAIAALWANSFSHAENKLSTLDVSSSNCKATLGSWLEQAQWPENDVLLGEKILNRSQLKTLTVNQKSPLANLASALAAAQLNLAAGAHPKPHDLDAIFDADAFFIAKVSSHKVTTKDRLKLGHASSLLHQFNYQASLSTKCR